MRGKYLTHSRLIELDGLLSERDKAMLRSLEACRYLQTGHIARLHFAESINATAALRAANRAATKLRSYGLAEPLQRRIGGVRAGSNALVWTLTASGVNLLYLKDAERAPRKRSHEPEFHFLSHILAVSETYTRLVEICRQHRLQLTAAELEPDAWRDYVGKNGKRETLKPDLFAKTETAAYEYTHFFEVDMATEAVRVVLAKCQRYAEYHKSGVEQKAHDVFPLVVWLVPDQTRKERLRLAIEGCRELSRKHIFLVITPDEFEALVIGGAESLTAANEEVH